MVLPFTHDALHYATAFFVTRLTLPVHNSTQSTALISPINMDHKVNRRLPILDHIVVLVSYQTLNELPERLQGTLNVADGGGSSAGVTVNKLVIFPDGCYLELVAFSPDADVEKRKCHRWGHLAEGAIVDWAYTLHDDGDFAAIQKHVNNDDRGCCFYRDPIPGGRVKPDGTELRWAVSLAASKPPGRELLRGAVPFWCLDKTPRDLRVPFQTNANANSNISSVPASTNHPCGAWGVSELEISVPQEEHDALKHVFQSIHGTPGMGTDGNCWRFGTYSSSVKGERRIRLSLAETSKPLISLTLLGTEKSPRCIDIILGIQVNIISKLQ